MGKPKSKKKGFQWGGRKAGLPFASALTDTMTYPSNGGDGCYPTVPPPFHKHLLSIYYVSGTEDTKHVTWAEHEVLRVEVSAVQGTAGTGGGEA